MNFACIAAGLTGALVLGLNAQPALAQSAAAKGQTEGSQAYDPGQRKASPATTVPDQTGGDRNGGGRNGQGRGARRDPYETPPSRYPPGGSDGGSDRRLYNVGIDKKGPGPVAAGQSAMFGLYPYNVGPSPVDASTGVTVTDTLPASFTPPLSYTANGWSCATAGLTLTCHYTGGTVGAGQSLPPITVSAIARTQGGYSNCADVTIKPKDANGRNDRSCIDGVVTPPKDGVYDVGIDKKGTGPVAAGQSASFGLYPYNVGPSAVSASTGVTVTDTLPANFTPPLSYTANGWACTTAGLTLTCHYTGGTVAAGQALPPITVSAVARTQGDYSNCAGVGIKPKDANARNDRSCVNGVVTPPKDGVYDVGIEKKGPGPIVAGQSAMFGLYPYNVGPSAVSASTGVTVTDTLPANFIPPLSYTASGWSCTTAGLTLTCHYTGGTVGAGQALPPITVSAVARTQGDYSNCAGVGIKPKDANARNDRSCVNGVVTPPKDGVYDVGIEKKGPGPIVAGQSAMFGLYPYNVGPSAVSASTGVTVTDTLPANFIPPLSYTANGWACTTASLTLTCHYTGGTVGAGQALPPITVSAVARTQGGYTNCSDVGIKPKDNDSRNNRSCIDGTVTGSGKPTAVCVTKYNDLNGNGMLDSGEPPLANWQFTIRNSAGVIVAQGVTKANGGFCTGGDRPIAPGPYTVTETLQPNWVSTDPGGSAPQKTVTAVSGQTVQALFGNRAGRITKPSLTIEKVVTQDCSGSPPNTLCKFMVRVFNTGQAPYTGPLTFTDLVTSFGSPTGGVSLAPPYPPGWSCTGVQPLSCSSGSVTLQLGSFVAVPLNMNINGAVPPNRNCASLTAPMAAGPSCVTVGSTHYDLLIDSNFMNAPGAPGFHDLSFYVSSTPAPPPGTQLIVNGSLTSNVTFAPRTVIGSSWTCSGPWTGFVCTLTMPSGYGGGTPVLTLRTSYPSAGSGHAVTYAGTVTKNNNIDPNPANNTRTVNSTLP